MKEGAVAKICDSPLLSFYGLRDHCIVRHSLRYYRHSDPVIYISKLPAPSVSMPCYDRILQSPTKEQVKLALWEAVGRSRLN